MKIDILCVGKMKESYLRDAVCEYSKRLSRYISLNIYEVKDEKTPDNASDREVELILNNEAERLKKHIVSTAMIIPLCIEGKQYTSEEFSNLICNTELNSISHIQFIIGGSLGLSDEIKKMGKVKLSFSKMTLPHMLMRTVLLEQIYRAYKIKTNEPYHK